MMLSLSEIGVGKEGTILTIQGQEVFLGRLRQFGFIEGTKIRCIGIAPPGSPMLFGVRGTILAIRRHECIGISVVVP